MRNQIKFRGLFQYLQNDMKVGGSASLELRGKTYRIKRGKDKNGDKVFAVGGGTLEAPQKGDELKIIKIINGDSYEK